ncbi:glycine dehydrogenase [Pseudooceanicola batsensis HTCC2597]|uniref:Glycine dehydrogenase n=1 Tax=Pseudooceanicola batsensis (strain ATCC BAA-863 / DSM 15984 / KCTC 12145 / HTCC2597) TaxID=252305 RepID=A3U2D0_PSEBH|nr:glycine dehydrogenase [Pseudooceanicola batsensis HTCC2597]
MTAIGTFPRTGPMGRASASRPFMARGPSGDPGVRPEDDCGARPAGAHRVGARRFTPRHPVRHPIERPER